MAEPAPVPNTKVQISARDVVYRDRLLPINEIIEVPEPLARQWVRDRRAIPADLIRCRFTKQCFHGSRTWSAGEEVDVLEFSARHLYEHNVADVLTKAKLTQALPPRLGEPASFRQKAEDLGRKVKAIVKSKTLLYDRNTHVRGDAVSLPVERARMALASGAIELSPGEQLGEPQDSNSPRITPSV